MECGNFTQIYIWTLNGMWQLCMDSYALDFEWPIMFKLGLHGLLMNYNMCRNPSFGLVTKAKGLQGCGPRGSPGVKAKRSQRCGPRKSSGVTSHTPRSCRCVNMFVWKLDL
jgi:hypothetical protein